MSHRALVWTVLPAALLAAAAADARGGHHGHGITTSGGRGGGITRCDQWHVEFGDRDAAVAQESVTIPVSDASPLVASSSENGGATVVGSDGKDFEVTVCKAAPEDDRKTLDAIRIVREKGRLSVDGPDSEWAAHLIIRAPKNASVDLQTINGPVDVSDFDGRARISSDNGPVSLRRSSGEIDVQTTNGPIDFDGGSGKVRLDAENGPLTVRLRDAEWRGGGFEGRTRNGPLRLRIADNYGSGVLVLTSGHSPFHCGAEACRHARRNWDDDGKSIAFGPETAVVKLETRNGPVSIGD